MTDLGALCDEVRAFYEDLHDAKRRLDSKATAVSSAIASLRSELNCLCVDVDAGRHHGSETREHSEGRSGGTCRRPSVPTTDTTDGQLQKPKGKKNIREPEAGQGSADSHLYGKLAERFSGLSVIRSLLDIGGTLTMRQLIAGMVHVEFVKPGLNPVDLKTVKQKIRNLVDALKNGKKELSKADKRYSTPFVPTEKMVGKPRADLAAFCGTLAKVFEETAWPGWGGTPTSQADEA